METTNEKHHEGHGYTHQQHPVLPTNVTLSAVRGARRSSDDLCVLLQRATLGSSGSNRITSITCWSEEEGISYDLEDQPIVEEEEEEDEEDVEEEVTVEMPKKRAATSSALKNGKKGKTFKQPELEASVMEDAEAVARARKLIEKSKKIKRKSDKKAAKARKN